MTRTRGLVRILAGLGVLLAALFILTTLTHLGPETSLPRSCAGRMTLVPRERPGKPWQHHRHWLEGSTIFNVSPYVIINLRTTKAYRWAFWDNMDGHARFGVRTRWIWLHPQWKHDPWLLWYDCAD